MDAMRSFLFLLVVFNVSFLASAALDNSDGTKVYIVHTKKHPLALELTEQDDSLVESFHYNLLSDVLDGSSAPAERVVYSYKSSMDGFAARLTEQEKEKLSGKDDVVLIQPSKAYKPLTTRSWSYLGVPNHVQGSLPFEQDVIIGMLDTGVWPESESFSDEGLPPPPKKWKGACQNMTCNNKIIGARYYQFGRLKEGFSPRDTEGHGTHTASTAVGRVVNGASMYGVAEGSARGAVPSARLAIYKVCWPEADIACQDVDILAALDDAIVDGVDIISVSLGGDSALDYFDDTMAVGSFRAMRRGILTSMSAGNSGPKFHSVTNVAPWTISVAAMTTDRRIVGRLILGNNKPILGTAVNAFPSLNNRTFHPLATPRSCDLEGLNGTSYKGKIILCSSGAELKAGMLSGVAGIVVPSASQIAFVFPLPTLLVPPASYNEILNYVNRTRSPVGRMLNSEAAYEAEAPTVAKFSSRGPNAVTPSILKPDIGAPGVDILAAWPLEAPVYEGLDDGRKFSYNIISGTSMSCPHVTGAAAYVKSVHPKWSPAMISSALITTATPVLSYHPQAELAYGAGQVNPVSAVNPGLVYDALEADYINMLCAQGYNSTAIKIVSGSDHRCPAKKGSVTHLNYPTMALSVTPNATFHAVFPRTVTNVGAPSSVYRVKTNSVQGVTVRVAPQELVFSEAKQKLSFTVHVRGSLEANQQITSASIVWSDGKFSVRSPISVFSSDLFVLDG